MSGCARDLRFRIGLTEQNLAGKTGSQKVYRILENWAVTRKYTRVFLCVGLKFDAHTQNQESDVGRQDWDVMRRGRILMACAQVLKFNLSLSCLHSARLQAVQKP